MIASLSVSCGSKKSDAISGRALTNEIVVGIAQDLDDSLDPHKAVKAGTNEVMFNVFEGLLKPSPRGELLPAIAKSFSVSADSLSYTFVLREGVRFHNGEVVTAEDVVYSIEKCKAGTISASDALRASVTDITSDDNSVTVKIAKPNNEFLSYMTIAILPKNCDAQDTMPIGTGPFKFVSRAAQDSVIMERFDDYWGAEFGNAAHLSKVTFKIMENADSMLMGLQSGAIDVCAHLTATQTAQLSEDFNIEEASMNLVQALYLNNAVKPFDDVRVRQAMCYAVNKHELIELAFDGYGLPIGSSMYPSFAKYFDESLTDFYEYNPEKAKALLREAGYEDGISITITAPSNYKPHMDTAEVLVELLSRSNITATIQTIEWESWLSDVYVGRNFQSTVVGLVASNMTARSLLERFVTGNGRNFIGYSSSNYDELFLRTQITTDDDEQTRLYKLMERDLAENAANLYIQDLADLVAVRKGIGGLQFYPIYVIDLSSVRYDERYEK